MTRSFHSALDSTAPRRILPAGGDGDEFIRAARVGGDGDEFIC